MQPFFAYMLRCSDGSYYVGHTDELEKRVVEHESGAMGGYTATRRPVALVWSEEFPTREEALEVELRLKGWSRAKKEALVRGDWAALKALARGPNRSERLNGRGRPDSSPFDFGPAGGGPYAQGERGSAHAVRAASDSGNQRTPEREHLDSLADTQKQPRTSVRPERSGRAAAAESKGERSRA